MLTLILVLSILLGPPANPSCAAIEQLFRELAGDQVVTWPRPRNLSHRPGMLGDSRARVRRTPNGRVPGLAEAPPPVTQAEAH